jgi:HTH-type transcriptional regulator/antitoxin HipB
VQVRTAKEIGTFIRDQRKRQKLDQATLASRIGVNRRWVMEVERGKPRAEIDLVLKALEALGLSLSVDLHDVTSPTADALDIVDIDAIVRKAKGPAT